MNHTSHRRTSTSTAPHPLSLLRYRRHVQKPLPFFNLVSLSIFVLATALLLLLPRAEAAVLGTVPTYSSSNSTAKDGVAQFMSPEMAGSMRTTVGQYRSGALNQLLLQQAAMTNSSRYYGLGMRRGAFGLGLGFASNVERYLNLFVPTHKCSVDGYDLKGWHCRAVLTAYRNKETNRMNVIAGYTIFNDFHETAPIPKDIIYNIQFTTDYVQIFMYALQLGTNMVFDTPDLCDFPFVSTLNAIKKSVNRVHECTHLTHYSCGIYDFVAAC